MNEWNLALYSLPIITIDNKFSDNVICKTSNGEEIICFLEHISYGIFIWDSEEYIKDEILYWKKMD